ncbi:hypothetical protein BDK51DRAFT_35318 [Blyttiomyces helicus]|uniref:Uncharacterized protein n=1 Tax=Blyttiomyces helicus TaxID=388810 RepID=A0A4V1IQZ6_9FUNG|nr:hypothetical protein BDK51DRAFT_35318 [Blyttiomyces helicus]|eukprot:RKO88287.1 hypothetical protein BDK51DRAFT_35318 [Blyttiomyces helicus]
MAKWPPSPTELAWATAFFPLVLIWYMAGLAAYVDFTGDKDTVVNWLDAPLWAAIGEEGTLGKDKGVECFRQHYDHDNLRSAGISLAFLSGVVYVFFSGKTEPKTLAAFANSILVIIPSLFLRYLPLDVCCTYKSVPQDDEAAATSIAAAMQPVADIALSKMNSGSPGEEPEP